MIPFTKYCQIKDKYCLIYLGSSKEYLVQLRLLKPFIEEQLKGLELNVCCRDEYVYIMRDNAKTFPYSQINSYKEYFAHTKEIKCDMKNHPILSLMNESSLAIPEIPVIKDKNRSRICSIISDGILPTQSIPSDYLEKIKNKILGLGFSFGDYQDAELVVGIESEEIFEAAASGKRTVLVETGLGTELFSKMFPNCEIWIDCNYKMVSKFT